jgi:hypothetical protein
VQPRERFWNALWLRAPELASELDGAERALYGHAAGDAELLQAARRLHDVAYPGASELISSRTTKAKEAR